MAQSFTDPPPAAPLRATDRRLRNLILLAIALAWVVIGFAIRALLF